MNNNLLKAIVFDLDDTLYPQVEYKRSGFRIVASWLEKRTGIDRTLISGELETILSRYGASYPYMFDRLVENLNIKHPDIISEMIRVFIEHEPKIRCFDGVMPLLEKLRASYRLGILTDGRLSVQQKKINALQLENKVNHILCSDSLKLEKPALELFQWFENQFNMIGKQLAYIGDNPKKDFYGANLLGWLTVQVMTGEFDNYYSKTAFKAKYSIPTILDIEAFLQQCQ